MQNDNQNIERLAQTGLTSQKLFLINDSQEKTMQNNNTIFKKSIKKSTENV
jgi:hypothetical protein